MTAPPFRPPPDKAPLLVLIALQAIWLYAARLWTGVGWGWSPALQTDDSVRMGWMTNLPDSLSYSSWMEQARNGSTLFQLIYTTSPHPVAYFNPVLWLVGTLSRILGGAPTGWLNLGGFAAALLCTALIHAIALRLDLGRRAAFWSAAVTAFGSGCSWISVVLSKLTGGEAIRGADLRYMDLLPSSAMLVYPFHTIGFALVATLWWLVLKLEQPATVTDGRPPAPASAGWWVLTGGVGLMLASSRPYEPAAFLAIYGLYTLSSFVISPNRMMGYTRLRIWLVLAAGVCPALLYSVWLSRQPVWRDFAAQSLQITHPRNFWLIGFGGLWALDLLGLPALLRGKNSPRYFPACWVVFGVLWLAALNAPQSKLVAGGGLAISLAAGVGIAGLLTWVAPLRRWMFLAASGAIIGLFAGPLSLLLIVNEAATFPPALDEKILRLAEDLRPTAGKATPTVLCELDVGSALPGIAGLRVVCGHWSLTDQYATRRGWLREAGLQKEPPINRSVSQQFARLRELAATERCDYLLISDRRPVAALVAQDDGFQLHQNRGEWRVYRIVHK